MKRHKPIKRSSRINKTHGCRRFDALVTGQPSHARGTLRSVRFRRSGAVLIAALLCVLIVTTILGAMIEGTLHIRRQFRNERNHRQAEFLLQAGIDRAAYQLATNTNYQGETWLLPGASIAGRGAGQVTISTSRSSPSQPSQVTVVAEYPSGSARSIRRTSKFTFPPHFNAIPE